MKTLKQKKVLAFGEVLFDIFPKGIFIGGGPANAAAHMAKLGLQSTLLSCVGRDEMGERALAQMKAFGMDTSFIGQSDLPTGQVHVTVDESGIPTYLIQRNVAYDEILLVPSQREQIRETGYDALYFGTLAQRSLKSRSTLHKLIENEEFPVRFLDINLRNGFYDEHIVRISLQLCSILKLNEEELMVLSEMLHLGTNPVYELFSLFNNIQVCVVTKGAQGVSAFTRDNVQHVPGNKVTIADTVGAGDAFSAAFLFVYLSTVNLTAAVKAGNLLGAYVASQSGAVPEYNGEIVNKINALL